ncbi:MAG TPA: COX aromatic rich motif-containing protein [Candidatus Paceibacterota bacterium]|nr:COX aromatic rich motif-containing protein [Candidatus Paceibacterota bacterium]
MSGGVFDPQGPIALQERNLIILVVLIMLVVAIPMLIALYTFAWKYRAGNKKAKYDPEHVGSVWRQLVWWVIPAVIIVAIGIIDWQSTHALDPSKPIVSNVPPLTIEVVALEWKWLFIYPAQGIATVNFIQFPVTTPIHFELTADAPMSSFWIPQLGSQIYAMAAMETQLNLEADTTGEYTGKDTEINGAGYAGMIFLAKSTSRADFNAWVASVQNSSNTLTMDSYNALAAPSQNNPPAYYSSVDKNLYDTILMKYMIPQNSATTTPMSMPMMPATNTTATTSTMPANMPGMRM